MNCKFNNSTLNSIRYKLYSINLNILFLPGKMVAIPNWEIGKLICIIEAVRFLTLLCFNGRGKSVHKFNRMIPDSAHLTSNMPANIWETAILMTYHIHAIASRYERRGYVLGFTLYRLKCRDFLVKTRAVLFFRGGTTSK